MRFFHATVKRVLKSLSQDFQPLEFIVNELFLSFCVACFCPQMAFRLPFRDEQLL